MNHVVVATVCGFGCFIIDRVTKAWALATCAHAPVIFNQFFSCELVINYGMTWGMLYDYGEMLYIPIIIGVVLICAALGYSAYERLLARQSAWQEAVVIGSALSNVVDRVWVGGVIDYLLFSYGQWHFPTFNVADAGIVLGLLCLVIRVLCEKEAS